jgi:predicted O-methyltransferase YrrM
MRIDPYLVKKLPKHHPRRLAYTAFARWSDYLSRYFYHEYELPKRDIANLPQVPSTAWEETQVLPQQAQYLLWALKETEQIAGCVVEVGAWRGTTTAVLASHTRSTVVAIDPWIGDSNEANMNAFLSRTKALINVTYERKPFGQAVREWNHGPVRFIFIDAAHDYRNVAHDLAAARSLLTPGAMIALHDVDNIAFPGCRRAVYEIAEQFELAVHADNLAILGVR